LAKATEKELVQIIEYLKAENRVLRSKPANTDRHHESGTSYSSEVRRAAWLKDRGRAILTMKGMLARLLFVSYRRDVFLRQITAAADWHNEHRPHSWLRGPRFEPRNRWKRGSPCAKPWALVRGSPGAKLSIEVCFHEGRKHLPIVTVRRAA
jgi:hypothetical protein